MSYEIERGKRVLAFKTYDERFDGYGEQLVYVTSSSSNNVSPRHYDWSVVAIDTYREWNSEIMLPHNIWEAAAAADGGSIKPWDKDVSGIGYIKSWKAAVKARQPITGWTPRVCAYVGGYDEASAALAEKINADGVIFGKYRHLQDSLRAAFKRLFPRPVAKADNHASVNNLESLLDALYLYRHRKGLPFSFFISDNETSSFFAKHKEAVPA